MVVLLGGSVSHERGTPLTPSKRAFRAGASPPIRPDVHHARGALGIDFCRGTSLIRKRLPPQGRPRTLGLR